MTLAREGVVMNQVSRQPDLPSVSLIAKLIAMAWQLIPLTWQLGRWIAIIGAYWEPPGIFQWQIAIQMAAHSFLPMSPTSLHHP
jgi:hypothetical protein